MSDGEHRVCVRILDRPEPLFVRPREARQLIRRYIGRAHVATVQPSTPGWQVDILETAQELPPGTLEIWILPNPTATAC
jgi:hypothetical protein